MDYAYQFARQFLVNYNWNSPSTMWGAMIVTAFLFQRWMVLLTVVTVMFLGANIEKVLVFQYTFNNFTVTSSFMVYLIGGVFIFIMGFLSLFSR